MAAPAGGAVMSDLVLSADLIGAVVWLAVYVVVLVGYVYRDGMVLLLGGAVHVLVSLLMVVPPPTPVEGSVLLVLVVLGLIHIASGLRFAFAGSRR